MWFSAGSHATRTRRRDQRGLSISPFVAVIMGSLIITAGLVIDGGQKISAASRAETAAAGASRAAGNAAATQQLGGRDPAGSAVLAGRAYLAGQPGVHGTVTLAAGVVTVSTYAEQPTIFLSVIGIDSVRGTGFAKASVVATGERR
jgi:hypothetical protein